MTSAARTIRDWKARADQYDGYNALRGSFWRLTIRSYDYTARDVVRFCEEHCRGTGSRQSKPISRFVRHFRRDDAIKLESVDLLRLMRSYMKELDDLFFFGLLTRKTPSGQLVVMRVKHRHSIQRNWAVCDESGSRITLYEFRSEDERATLGQLVESLAHEMVHSLLDIFPYDLDEDRHNRYVEEREGHGQMFRRYLRFIKNRLKHWLPEEDEFGPGPRGY